MDFYLQDSRSYTGNALMWWAKGGRGYTSNLLMAEVFTKESAQRQNQMRPTDIPWPVEYIQGRAMPVVDHQYLNVHEALAHSGITLTPRPPEPRPDRYKCCGCGVFMSAASYYTGPCRRCNQDNRP